MKAIIAMLRLLRETDWRLKLNEFRLLCETVGYEIVEEVIQTKPAPFSATLFGRGKLEEIAKIAEEKQVDVILIWNSLSPIQRFNIEQTVKRSVMDRNDVILEIFNKHATDAVSKLQIELAQLRRQLPYLKLWVKLRKTGERPYTRAGGEYAWKWTWRDVRRRISLIREKIEALRKQKLQYIKRRKEEGFKFVCLVGYFNAGKSSLFNALARTHKAQVDSKPFTTLASKFVSIPELKNVLLVDTIGFAAGLDPRIIKSFAINLDEMRNADMLLWVVDVSDEYDIFAFRTRAAAEVLSELKLFEKPHIVVANKIDKDIPDIEKKIEFIRMWTNAPIIKVSAKTGKGLDELKRKINEFLLKST